MKIRETVPPRTFMVGKTDIVNKECAHIELEPEELVTFTTPAGNEYDVVRKSWGFYATPSLNKRLPEHGFTPLLARGRASGTYFVFLVEAGREAELEAYLEAEDIDMVCPLDEEHLKTLDSRRT